jgi:hypothetical protein
MEQHFDHDFSRLRAYTDAKAAQSADARPRVRTDADAALAAARMGAMAYAHGNDIFLGAAVRPATSPGRRLIAHETAHVLQQTTRGLPAGTAREAEADADAYADAALAGHPVRVRWSRPVEIARQTVIDPEAEGAALARRGLSMVKADSGTRWDSQQRRRQTISAYLRTAATDPKHQAQYREALAAYPDIARSIAAQASPDPDVRAQAPKPPPEPRRDDRTAEDEAEWASIHRQVESERQLLSPAHALAGGDPALPDVTTVTYAEIQARIERILKSPGAQATQGRRDFSASPRGAQAALYGTHFRDDNERLSYALGVFQASLGLDPRGIDPDLLFGMLLSYEVQTQRQEVDVVVHTPPTKAEQQRIGEVHAEHDRQDYEAYLAEVKRLNEEADKRTLVHGGVFSGTATIGPLDYFVGEPFKYAVEKFTVQVDTRHMVSLMINFVPIVGQVKAVAEAIVGFDLITGDDLPTWERGLNLLLAIIPEAKGIFSSGRAGLRTLARVAVDSGKSAEEVYQATRVASRLTVEEVQAAEKVAAGGRATPAQLKLAAKLEEMPGATAAGHAEGLSQAELERVDQAFTEYTGPQTRPARTPLRRPTSNAASTSARARFDQLRSAYAERLGVGTGGQVHHAIELQALDRYPGVSTEAELNAFNNMRGIPAEAGGLRQLHNSKVREIWDRTYRELDQAIAARRLTPGTSQYNQLVRSYLEQTKDSIDHVLGQFFSEYRTGRPRSFQ